MFYGLIARTPLGTLKNAEINPQRWAMQNFCREWPCQMLSIRVAQFSQMRGTHLTRMPWRPALVGVNLWNSTDGAGTKRAKRLQLLAACRILAATMLEVPLRVFAVCAARIAEMKHVKSDVLIHWTPRGWLFVSSVVRKYDVSLQVTTVSHVNDWQLELPTPKLEEFWTQVDLMLDKKKAFVPLFFGGPSSISSCPLGRAALVAS